MSKVLKVIPKNYKASDYIIETKDRNGKTWYVTTHKLRYFSKRYKRWIVCQRHFVSDGATGAYDIDSFGWLFHDKLCDTGMFDDSSQCTNWQASSVVSDILRNEGRYIRAQTWRYATFIGGGGKARKNGMFTLK